MNIYKKILSFLLIINAITVASCHGMYFFKKREPKPPFDPVKAICMSLAEKGKAFYRTYPKTSWAMGLSAVIITAYWAKLYFDEQDLKALKSQFTPVEKVMYEIECDARVLHELIMNKKTQFLWLKSNVIEVYYKKLAFEIDQRLHEKIVFLLDEYRAIFELCRKEQQEKNLEQFKAQAEEIKSLLKRISNT